MMEDKPHCLVFRHCDSSLQILTCFEMYQGPNSAKYKQSFLLSLGNKLLSQEPHNCDVQSDRNLALSSWSRQVAWLLRIGLLLIFASKWYVCGSILSVHNRVLMKQSIVWPLNNDDKKASIVELSKTSQPQEHALHCCCNEVL